MRFSHSYSRHSGPFLHIKFAAVAITGGAALGLFGSASPQAFAQAQQTPIPEEPSTQPQIDIAGTGAVTLDLGRSQNTLSNGDKASGSQINLSDSALAVSAAQRLYKGGIGSFTIGGLSTD